MSLTITTPQGVPEQQLYHKDAHVFGRFAITFDDSNDPPDITDNTPEDAIDLRVRSSGEIFFWDSINELWKPTFPVNQVILFSVGDGQQYSPEAGDTQYLNPTLENISGGIITRNGMPLVSGYTFLSEGGFEVDSPFSQGEVIQWSLETNITTEPIDYSVYTKRQDVATYSSIVSTGADRLIFVAADETNGGNPSVFFLKNNTLKRIISQDTTAGAGQYQISLSLLQDALTSANSFSSTGDATTLAQAIAYAQGLAQGLRRVAPTDSPITGETSVVPTVAGTYTNFSGVVVSSGDFVASNVYIDLIGATWTKRVVTVPSPTFPFVKTSTMATNVNAGAIKDVRMYGANRNKKYYLKELSRNFGSNHFYSIVFEEDGLSRTQGVCGVRNVLASAIFVGGVEPAAGVIQTMYLKDQNSSTITGEVDLIWSEIADNTNITFTNYSGGGLDSRVIIKSDADRPVRFPNVSGDMSFITHTNWISAANIAPWWNSSNTWATTFPMQQLVSDIEIENAISPQQFYVSAIGKNTAGDIFVRLGVVGGSPNYLGFQINGLDVSTKKTYKSKDGVNGISLTNSAGVTLKNITVDWPNVFLNTTTAFQSGSYAISGIASAVVKYREDATYTQANYRLLFPKKLYAFDDEKLPIYGAQLHSGFDYPNYVETTLSNTTGDVPFSAHLVKLYKLDPAELDNGSTVRALTRILSPDSDVIVNLSAVNGRDFTFNKVSKSSLVGKTATIAVLGDSITDFDVTDYIGDRFAAIGANLTFIGTRTDGGYGNEGRASWDWKRFIGRKTRNNDGTPLAPAPGAALTTNPFITVATSQDLIDHPTWCFENNVVFGDHLGRNTELNYTESQAAGGYVGSYYTFNYAYYLTSNSITVNPANKFIVCMNLGYNDIVDSNPDLGLADALLGIEIFCKRMWEYRNDTIIGISPIQLYNGKLFESYFSQYIEKAITLVDSLAVNTSYTPRIDVDIVPVYASTSRVDSYDYLTTTPLSADNDTFKALPIDGTHPYTFGKKQFANIETYFIGNNL